MSRINGEKARASIAKRNRTAMREKTRGIVRGLRAAAAAGPAAAPKAPAAPKKPAAAKAPAEAKAPAAAKAPAK